MHGLAGALSAGERAELCRQGAKAAARGECSAVNPFLHRRNSPPHTGESTARWRERSSAWQAGHDFQRRRSPVVREQAAQRTPLESVA
jgi:hypothetical protein